MGEVRFRSETATGVEVAHPNATEIVHADAGVLAAEAARMQLEADLAGYKHLANDHKYVVV